MAITQITSTTVTYTVYTVTTLMNAILMQVAPIKQNAHPTTNVRGMTKTTSTVPAVAMRLFHMQVTLTI